MRKLEIDNELDKQRIEYRFDKEMKNMIEYFKMTVSEVRKEFTDDIRNM
jgi:hypothetical protein